MRALLARLGVVVALLWLAASTGLAQSGNNDVQELVKLWHQDNSSCRGSSGVDPDTFPPCLRRQKTGEQLDAKGYCYGKDGEYGYQMEWHRCGPTSTRNAAKSAPVPQQPQQQRSASRVAPNPYSPQTQSQQYQLYEKQAQQQRQAEQDRQQDIQRRQQARERNRADQQSREQAQLERSKQLAEQQAQKEQEAQANAAAEEEVLRLRDASKQSCDGRINVRGFCIGPLPTALLAVCGGGGGDFARYKEYRMNIPKIVREGHLFFSTSCNFGARQDGDSDNVAFTMGPTVSASIGQLSVLHVAYSVAVDSFYDSVAPGSPLRKMFDERYGRGVRIAAVSEALVRGKALYNAIDALSNPLIWFFFDPRTFSQSATVVDFDETAAVAYPQANGDLALILKEQGRSGDKLVYSITLINNDLVQRSIAFYEQTKKSEAEQRARRAPPPKF